MIVGTDAEQEAVRVASRPPPLASGGMLAGQGATTQELVYSEKGAIRVAPCAMGLPPRLSDDQRGRAVEDYRDMRDDLFRWAGM